MRHLDFLAANARWLGAGFLLALGSSFGQTYFISIFSAPFRAEFGLSQGDFGQLYMIGTLASAAMMLLIGRAADFRAARWVAAAVIVTFALVCIGVSAVDGVVMLCLLIFGLRLTGQGMMSLLSQAYVARWFAQNRGRALAITALGYTVGEALLPRLAVGAFETVGWRETWMIAAGMLAFGFLPAIWLLLSEDRSPKSRISAPPETMGLGGRAWRRGEVTRHWVFWALLPGICAPSFIGTTLFFYAQHIADIKAWELADIAESYAIYAVFAVFGSLIFGFRVDRVGAVACLPIYQFGVVIGFIGVAYVEDLTLYWAMMALIGFSFGATQPVHTAVWAELYGSRHIGSVKSMAHAGMVLGSALGPGLVGALLDAGVSFETQSLCMAGATLGFCVIFELIRRRLSLRGELAPTP